MRPEEEIKAKQEVQENLLFVLATCKSIAEQLSRFLEGIIPDAEKQIGKLAHQEKLRRAEQAREDEKKNRPVDPDAAPPLWTKEYQEEMLKPLNTQRKNTKWIADEIATILNQLPDRVANRLHQRVDSMHSKALQLIEELRVSDETRPGSAFLDQANQAKELRGALREAQALASFEVMLAQVRQHDSALTVLQCHHASREEGHVKYDQRWAIGDIGAARIAAAVAGMGNCLGPNPYVKAIYLQGNGITAAGVTSIIDGVKLCPQIAVLNLQGNQIGADGAAKIGAAVKEGILPNVCF